MLSRIACSIFTIAVVAGCSGACWLPGGDGSCPSGGGLGDSSPSYHSYRDPQLIKHDGALSLVMFSADDADDYTQFAGDMRVELALPAPIDGTAPRLVPTRIPDGYSPSFACGTTCIGAWHSEQDPIVNATIRTAAGWSAPIAFEAAIRSPATAAFGDVLLVAWSSWVADTGARVELRRLDPSGNVTGSWTLATGASHGHLSVTASAIGGLVTWQRYQTNTDGNTFESWVDAQLLDTTGTPTGAPLELAIAETDADYYRAAPAVFAGGVYRIAHGGLGAGVPWFVVDPAALSIALDPLADSLAGPIEQIVPLADGFALSIGEIHGSVVHVSGGRVAQSVALDGAATIAPTPGGGVTAAYAIDGSSVYVAQIPSTFDAVVDTQEVATRYLVDDGGCSASGGGVGPLAMLALALLTVRRRRASRARPAACPPVRAMSRSASDFALSFT